MAFTHLHVHTEFSLLDGSNKIKEYVARVKELGMNSAAITDHGVMFGVIDFYKAAKTAFYANSTNPKAATVHALNFGASKEFTDRVPLAELDERYGLTVEAVADRIRRVLAR